MRHRARSINRIGTFIGYEWWADMSHEARVIYTYPYSFITSQIDDVKRGLGRQNPCSQIHQYSSAFPVFYPKGWDTVRERWVQYQDDDFWRAITNLPFPSLPSVNYTEALANLYADAAGSMPLSANLVVNAVEFASVKTLIPQACQIARKILKAGLKRKSLKEMANGHLLYSFGVAPLITDIKAILNVRQNVKKRIAELQRRSGRTLRLSSRTGQTVSNLPDSWVFAPSSSARRLECEGEWRIQSSGCVSADVTSFFVSDASSQTKLWSSALGLSSPLSSIWELIPFSFVADWLLPIGAQFERVESKLGMHETVRSHSLSNFTYSHKHVCWIDAQGTNVSTAVPSWNGLRFNVPTVFFTAYNRSQGIPGNSWEAVPSGWSLKRTALSVSLLLQKKL